MDCASRSRSARIPTAFRASTARRRVMSPRPEDLARIVDSERENRHMPAIRAIIDSICATQRPRTRGLLTSVSECQFFRL